jgi:hypothetical protein
VILVKKLEANNDIIGGLVDVNRLDHHINWKHAVVVSPILISLLRPGPIGHDKIEQTTLTILLVVLESSDQIKHSVCKPLVGHSSSRKKKILQCI